MRYSIHRATLLIGLCILAGGNQAARAEDTVADASPTIAKDSVNATAYTVGSFQKNFDVWSWVPALTYRVNGPIPSGGKIWGEFKLPTGPWVKVGCKTKE